MSSFICFCFILVQTVSFRATGRTPCKATASVWKREKKHTFITNWMQVWDESFPVFVLFRIALLKSPYWFHAATLAECVPVDRLGGGFVIYSNTFSEHFPFRMIFWRSRSLRWRRRSSLLLTACSWSLIHTSILHPLVFFPSSLK